MVARQDEVVAHARQAPDDVDDGEELARDVEVEPHAGVGAGLDQGLGLAGSDGQAGDGGKGGVALFLRQPRRRLPRSGGGPARRRGIPGHARQTRDRAPLGLVHRLPRSPGPDLAACRAVPLGIAEEEQAPAAVFLGELRLHTAVGPAVARQGDPVAHHHALRVQALVVRAQPAPHVHHGSFGSSRWRTRRCSAARRPPDARAGRRPPRAGRGGRGDRAWTSPPARDAAGARAAPHARPAPPRSPLPAAWRRRRGRRAGSRASPPGGARRTARATGWRARGSWAPGVPGSAAISSSPSRSGRPRRRPPRCPCRCPGDDLEGPKGARGYPCSRSDAPT